MSHSVIVTVVVSDEEMSKYKDGSSLEEIIDAMFTKDGIASGVLCYYQVDGGKVKQGRI